MQITRRKRSKFDIESGQKLFPYNQYIRTHGKTTKTRQESKKQATEGSQVHAIRQAGWREADDPQRTKTEPNKVRMGGRGVFPVTTPDCPRGTFLHRCKAIVSTHPEDRITFSKKDGLAVPLPSSMRIQTQVQIEFEFVPGYTPYSLV